MQLWCRTRKAPHLYTCRMTSGILGDISQRRRLRIFQVFSLYALPYLSCHCFRHVVGVRFGLRRIPEEVRNVHVAHVEML